MRLGRVLENTRPAVRWRGPFSWQQNNSTRAYEYPWVYEQVSSQGRSLDILEIGGGLSGLQFVLARAGHRITNLDPGVTPNAAAACGASFALLPSDHARLARALRAGVELMHSTIGCAGLSDNRFDLVVCVSSIEHFTDDALAELAAELVRIMKPTAVAIFTVDLFLDLSPFTSAETNRFGRNVDVQDLLARCGLRLDVGRRDQLLGFPEFDADAVQRDLVSLLVGSPYPALAQCFTARPKASG